MSKFEHVTDADDFEEDPEPTPIHDMNGAFRRIATMNRSVNRLVKQSKEMKEAVDTACQNAHGARTAANEALQHSEILRSRQEDFSTRLNTVDQTMEKLSGLNHQIDKAVSVLNSTVEKLGKETDGLRAGRAKVATTTISVALAIGLAISAWSWSLSGDISATQSDLRGESALRAAQVSALESRLQSLPSRDDVERIRSAVHAPDYEKTPSHEDLCASLSTTERATLRAQVMNGKIPRALGCD